MTIICSLGLIFYFLFYLNKINNLKILTTKQEETDSYETNNKEEEIDNEKFIELYNNILTYFEKKKPYCNPDFTVSQLAMALHTNVTYISKAIKIGKDTNFNIFINTYRVDMIKEMLEKDIQHKYTIRHIYISAGFRHQSTFNKVFKQIEGITPSEYIKNMDNKKERE